jgi:hypothetical protein
MNDPIKKHAGGRPRKIESPEQMFDAFRAYMDECESYTVAQLSNKGEVVNVSQPRIPTLGKFCQYLDIDRDTWSLYKTRPEFLGTIKKIEEAILAEKHDALLQGRGYGAGIMFDLKCNEGWRDKQVIEHEGEVHVTMNLNK